MSISYDICTEISNPLMKIFWSSGKFRFIFAPKMTVTRNFTLTGLTAIKDYFELQI
jgi:hypothetical protein